MPPRPLEIEVGASKLAEDIGLRLPPINVPLYISIWGQKLDFSATIVHQATELYHCYWSGSGFDQESPKALYYPHMIPLSCLMAAMKLVYGLDDAGQETEVDWLQWAEDQWKKLLAPSGRCMIDSETLRTMPIRECKAYSKRSHKLIFASNHVRRNFNGFHHNLKQCIKDQEKELKMPKKSESSVSNASAWNGVKFKTGDVIYVPPLLRYPCRLYWFVEAADNEGYDIDRCCPIDFAAVLSVMSEAACMKPEHLMACLASLERQMLAVELLCLKRHEEADVKPQRRDTKISVFDEKQMMRQALREMNIKKRKAEAMIDGEIEQLTPLLHERRRRMPHTRSDAKLIRRSVQWIHASDVSPSTTSSVAIPRAFCDFKERRLGRHEWTENPNEIFDQAKLARQLHQPIVSLGTKRILASDMNLHRLQTWAQDDPCRSKHRS